VTDAVAIYEGRAPHRRGAHGHSFSPRLFLAYLDVDALPNSLDALPGWSARRAAPVHVRTQDYFAGGGRALGESVRALVHERLGRRPAGPVFLLAQPRTWGYVFNPLAIYYCFDEGRLDALVLEVTNTPWREREWYVLDARRGSSGRVAKTMYVSPFLPMDVEYRVAWSTPGEHLALDIRVERHGTTVFDARLALRRRPLTRRTAIGVLVRHPLLPLRTVAAIYRHALRMWVRRVPYVRHRSEPTPVPPIPEVKS
jgi:DUF1365 family protein